MHHFTSNTHTHTNESTLNITTRENVSAELIQINIRSIQTVLISNSRLIFLFQEFKIQRTMLCENKYQGESKYPFEGNSLQKDEF